jgi:hypothetical protein
MKMAESPEQRALRIAEETSINFDGDASSNVWIVDFAHRLMAEQGEPVHSDDIAVDLFAEKMKEKLAEKRDEGYDGWDDPDRCAIEHLRDLLFEHYTKGDTVDIANFCMMLYQRGFQFHPYAAPPAEQAPQEMVDALKHIMWIKDCGVDGTDETGKFRNFPETERNAMYEIAKNSLAAATVIPVPPQDDLDAKRYVKLQAGQDGVWVHCHAGVQHFSYNLDNDWMAKKFCDAYRAAMREKGEV